MTDQVLKLENALSEQTSTCRRLCKMAEEGGTNRHNQFALVDLRHQAYDRYWRLYEALEKARAAA